MRRNDDGEGERVDVSDNRVRRYSDGEEDKDEDEEI